MFLQAASSKCCFLSDGTVRAVPAPWGSQAHAGRQEQALCWPAPGFADLSSLENCEHHKERIKALLCPSLETGGQDGTGRQCTPVVLAEV